MDMQGNILEDQMNENDESKAYQNDESQTPNENMDNNNIHYEYSQEYGEDIGNNEQNNSTTEWQAADITTTGTSAQMKNKLQTMK